MKNQKIGVAMTGSFCTFSQVLPVIRQLARSNEVTVVLSPAAAETDTRFYRSCFSRHEKIRKHIVFVTAVTDAIQVIRDCLYLLPV